MKLPWITIVLTLLGTSMVANLAFVWVAAHDPGLVIEERYDQRASAWDEHRARLERSAELGWTLEVSREAPLTLALRDRQGAPIREAEVTCSAERIGLRRRMEPTRFSAIEGGDYLLAEFPRETGLWEMRCGVRAAGAEWVRTLRHVFPRPQG